MHKGLESGRLLRIWWAWQWRTLVASFIGSVVLIFLFSAVAGIFGVDKGAITFVGNLIYIGVSLFASIYFLGFVLKKDFGDFRLSIVERVRCEPAQEQEDDEPKTAVR